MNRSKNKNIANISNEALEAYVKESNIIALKIFLYIARSDKIPTDLIYTMNDDDVISTSISIKNLLEYCQISKKTLDRNIKKLTETSIKINYSRGYSYVNILPWADFDHNGNINIKIFAIIAKLTHALKRFSPVDVSIFAHLKKTHSIRMLMILNRIKNYSSNVAKRKKYTLEELNQLFDTKYKTITEFCRRVLKPAKEELDQKSKLTFEYTIIKDKLERIPGRPKAIGVVIDLIERKDFQPKLFVE